MASGAAVADVLGVERPRSGETTEAAVIAQVVAGLPIASVDRLAAAVAPDDRASHSTSSRALPSTDAVPKREAS